MHHPGILKARTPGPPQAVEAVEVNSAWGCQREETKSELSKSRESIVSLRNQLEQLQIKYRQVESEHNRVKKVAEWTEAEKSCLKVESKSDETPGLQHIETQPNRY